MAFEWQSRTWRETRAWSKSKVPPGAGEWKEALIQGLTRAILRSKKRVGPTGEAGDREAVPEREALQDGKRVSKTKHSQT